MKEKQLKPLEGIIVPLVTPLANNDQIDVKSLEKLIEHVIEGGVHGIFVLGTSGEAQSISMRLREEMIRETSRILETGYHYWLEFLIHPLMTVLLWLKKLMRPEHMPL